ncbi:PAS domain-containing protein [Algihabitans albus]|uniref:PAS domain-containing protein n=1 Tax=Algihabitans albus TaxID=2164067 RepID=UPI00228705B1|nr:PAS domain-containing protein [Algihabitans albus]
MGEEVLSEIHGYWSRHLRGRRMPARADIDPADIPHLLPYLMLTDVLESGHYRYRLVGTEVERSFGAPMTGRTLEELMFGDYLVYMTGLYHRAVFEKRPIFSTSRYGGVDRDCPLFTKRVMMPLSNDGERVDMLLSAQVFLRMSALDDRTAHMLLHSVGHSSFEETGYTTKEAEMPVLEMPADTTSD